MATKTKKNQEKPNVQIRVRISNDHYEALRLMESATGLAFHELAAATFKQGVPQIQKRFAIDAETN